MDCLRIFTSLFLIILLHFNPSIFVRGIGVNYGMMGDNLPPPAQVIGLLKSRGVTGVRLFNPNLDALRALEGSGIQVILGTLNEDLQNLATNPSFAGSWVQTNVVPFHPSVQFRCISAGNEVIPGGLAQFVLPAMNNLRAALQSAGLGDIPVSTTVSTTIIGSSYPPSQGQFPPDIAPIMEPITGFLRGNNCPLLVNIYPYFTYLSNPQQIPLDYALFTHPGVLVQDGEYGYQNLFDAVTDTVYSALERVGAGSVSIIVAETGWPSQGEEVATVGNAQTYNSNLISRFKGNVGTPKRPGGVESYIFAVFNEDLKPPGTEQHFGLFYPDMSEVYHVDF